MNVFQLTFFQILLCLTHSASIQNKGDTLDILKKDVSQVGSAIQDFTFDVLRKIFDDSEEEAAATEAPQRRKRSVEEDVRSLCQKRYEDAQRLETEQIKELKDEVKKLQEMVKLLQDQEKVIDILDHDDSGKPPPKEVRAESESNDNSTNAPNTQELARMKSDLKDVINTLNQTRELINLQKEKDMILENELIKQKEEVMKLKLLVNTILHNTTSNVTPEARTVAANSTRNAESEENLPSHSSTRSSEMSQLRKLLKSLPDDDDDEELLHQLQKHLKKPREEKLFSIENKDDDVSSSEMLRKVIKAITKAQTKSRKDNLDVTTLSDLEEAINRLRPKENDADQFQIMLTKLINNQATQRPSLTTQQMNELTKRLTPDNTPFVCVVDDGGVKKNGYRVPINSRNIQPPPSSIDYNNRGQQFFQGQFTQPNYYPQGNVNGAASEKPRTYPGENGDFNKKYQEDLRQQIDGLQAAINNLNKPEYMQNPEDKAVVDDLERQIGDLRNVVNNLNYDPSYQRTKRSVSDNEVEDSKELAQKMTNYIDKLFENNNSQSNLTVIQDKINHIKKQLGSNNDKARTASSYTYNPLPSIDPSAKELERSYKNDFLSTIIGKILEKVIETIPSVLQRLFNFSFEELTKYDPQDYDIQILRKNLGAFALLPVLLLRLVNGISTFLNMLRKNTFFKNFLMPALILATVAGSVIFLIWWLRPDESYSPNYQDGYASDPTYQNYQYPPANNQYPSSYNYPVYNRSYYNK